MPTPTWLDPGGSATGGTEFALAGGGATTGAFSAQTSVVDDQPYAYLLSTGAGPANVGYTKLGVMGTARRYSARCRFSAAPAVDTAVVIVRAQPSGSGTGLLGVYLDSARKLRLYTNGSTTQLGATGTTVLSTNTFYRVAMCYSITSTTNWSCKIYIDGVLEFTRTNSDGTLSSAAPADFLVSASSTAGTNYNLYQSSIYVDDGSDQSDPGNVRVTAKKPTSVSSGSWDTTTGTGAVNERPVNTGNRLTQAATTQATIVWNVESAASGDVDISSYVILGRMAWMWATLSSLTGSPLGKMQLDGTANATVWDPATANTYQLFGQGPDAIASAPSTVGVSSSGIAADSLLSDIGVVVAYLKATITPITPSGGMTPSGVVVWQVQKKLVGGLTSSSTVQKQVNKILVRGMPYDLGIPYDTKVLYDQNKPVLILRGAVTPTKITGGGVQTLSVSGALTSAGALKKQVNKVLAGALTSAGSFAAIKAFVRTFAGTLSSAGVLKQTINKNLAGTLTSAGALKKQINKAWAGTLTTAGSFAGIKAFVRAFAGTMGSSGILVRQVNKVISGSLSTVGTLSRKQNKTLTGALTFSANVLKQVNKLFSGAMASAGSLGTSLVAPGTFSISVGGTLGTVGTLSKQVQKKLSGTMLDSGLIVRQINKQLSGTLTSSGFFSRIKVAPRAFSGALTSAGALKRTINKQLSGTLAPTGVLHFFMTRSLAGTLALSGVVKKTVNKILRRSTRYDAPVRYNEHIPYDGLTTPILAPSGTLQVKGVGTVLVSLSGAMPLAGALQKVAAKAFAGTLHPTGILTGGLRSFVTTFVQTITSADIPSSIVGLREVASKIGVAATTRTRTIQIVKSVAKHIGIAPRVER